MSDVGLEIKRRREQLGISQNQLAKRSGCAQSTINAIEKTTKKPGTETLRGIAAALGCTVAELMGEETGRGVPGVVLSIEDLDLLRVFHQLSPAGKAIVQATAEATLHQAEMRQETGIASAV